MDFSYYSYQKMIRMLQIHHYQFCGYDNYEQYDRCVILRHDIDNSLPAALELANLEDSMGVHSTFFVLVTSDFYNVFSKESREILESIQGMGHFIGLHFDEAVYGNNMSNDQMINAIKSEASILAASIKQTVKYVSMHRPSKALLDENLYIPGMINSYGKVFFRDFKYLSDSRCHWREPIEDIVQSEQYDRLHILTHAFWYHEQNQTLSETIEAYLRKGNVDRYEHMLNNITDLPRIINKGLL